MPSYDFSLPDNQGRLDKMQEELQSLEGEREKMRSWHEKDWYSDRFQDVDSRDRFQGNKPREEVILNPSSLKFEKPAVRYAFTHDSRQAVMFRDEVIGDRFRKRAYICSGVALLGMVVLVFINVQLMLVWVGLAAVFGILFGPRWYREYEQIRSLLEVVDHLAFEVSATHLYRKGEASSHVRMSVEQVAYVREISLGLLVGTYHSPVNVQEDIRRVLDDPSWLLIPKTLHGYALLKEWVEASAPKNALHTN